MLDRSDWKLEFNLWRDTLPNAHPCSKLFSSLLIEWIYALWVTKTTWDLNVFGLSNINTNIWESAHIKKKQNLQRDPLGLVTP